MREALFFVPCCLPQQQPKKERKERKLQVTEKVSEVSERQTFVLSASDLIVVCSDTNLLDVFLVIR